MRCGLRPLACGLPDPTAIPTPPYLSGMLSYSAWKVVHVVGLALTLLALGGASVLASVADPRAPGAPSAARKLAAALHGTGMTLLLVAGFGLLARLGMARDIPAWAWGKVGVWVVVAALLMVPYRRPALARPVLFLVAVLVALGTWLAIYKPA